MNSLAKSLYNGLASIGQGLSTFSLFPQSSTRDTIKPMSREEFRKNNATDLAGDWSKVGDDLRSVMDQMDAELSRQGVEPPVRDK